MGKVGSTSISESLKLNYGQDNVVHTHNHQEARKQIQQRSQQGNDVIVITGFREPLNRCISAYFENLTNSSNHWYVGEQNEVLNKSISWLIDDYNKKALPHVQGIIAPWLSCYENVIGYQLADFNKMGNYWKASLGRTHCYIYKLETITEFLQGLSDDQLIKDFEFSNSNVNIGEEKWSGEIYKEFKDKYRISEGDYYNIYGCLDYVDRLYSKDEIQKRTNSLVLSDI